MPNLIFGQNPGGAQVPIQVDDNGNLSIDLVSGVSVSAIIVDSNNTLIVNQVSGSNWSTNITGSSGTTVVVGNVLSDASDTGDAPVKVGGIARTANPTAVGAGDMVSASFDDVGRVVTYPYQVRDLVSTALAATSTLAEVALLAGVAATFHDLIQITLSNNSNVAVRINLRDATAGGIIKTFDIPATNTINTTFPTPVPQNVAADTWTIQNAGSGDISTTDVTVSALFIKNV